MAKTKTIPLAPTLEPIDDGYVCHWDHSDIVIELHHILMDPSERRIEARVVARIGDLVVNDTTINLLNQYARNDYHADCAKSERDGNVNWTSYIIALLEPLTIELRRRAEQGAVPGVGLENPWGRAKDVAAWLDEPEPEFEGIAKDFLAPGCLTFIAAPRGVGKTQIVHALCVALTTYGVFRGERLSSMRVLLLDRDNPERVTKQRLRAWGAMKSRQFRALMREQVPDLKDRHAWSVFPVTEYDVLMIDSFNSFIEGVTEKEGKQLTEALAVIKDVAGQGPAVLALHNCVKDGTTFKGRQDIVDRADIFYEVRDATGFVPNNPETWWEELPDAGEHAWANRATRHKGRTTLRLAFIASKFRLGPMPDPFCLELDLPGGRVWKLADVTAQMLREGEMAKARAQTARQAALDEAAHALAAVVMRIADERFMTKEEAEHFLRESCKLTRKDARALIEAKNGDLWDLAQLSARPGKPWVLTPRGESRS
jgi:hypothetical protein